MTSHRLCVLLAFAGVIFCPGCTEYRNIDIRGVVKSADDGKPLSGVEVYYSRYYWDPVDNGNEPDVATDASGRFSISTREAGGCPSTMRLILVKDGFEKEIIDIRPEKEPESYATPILIVVAAHLRRPGAEASRSRVSRPN